MELKIKKELLAIVNAYDHSTICTFDFMYVLSEAGNPSHDAKVILAMTNPKQHTARAFEPLSIYMRKAEEPHPEHHFRMQSAYELRKAWSIRSSRNFDSRAIAKFLTENGLDGYHDYVTFAVTDKVTRYPYQFTVKTGELCAVEIEEAKRFWREPGKILTRQGIQVKPKDSHENVFHFESFTDLSEFIGSGVNALEQERRVYETREEPYTAMDVFRDTDFFHIDSRCKHSKAAVCSE